MRGVHSFFIAAVAIFVAAVSLSASAATQELHFSPANLRFGAVAVGQTETQVVMLSNAGATGLKISAMSVSGSEFSVSGLNLPAVIAAGKSVPLTVKFTPTVIGLTSGKVTFTDSSSTTAAELRVAGVGAKVDPLVVTPSSLSFGQVAVGTKKTHSVVVTNDHTWSETLRSIQVMGTGFSVSAPTLPRTLLPGQSITLTVTFDPQVQGQDSGSVFISGPSTAIPLQGTGGLVGQFSVTPASLSFGKVDVGSSMKLVLTMKATGGSVVVSSAALSNSQFAIPGATFPLTIAAGQSESLDVVFTPTKGGTSSGNLTLTTDASSKQSTDSLTGVGVVPKYSVSLAWDASTSPVVGYNVYRGTTQGEYSKINASLDSSTTYVDGTVASGTTYYYAATAVNSKGEESNYSTPIKVSIP